LPLSLTLAPNVTMVWNSGGVSALPPPQDARKIAVADTAATTRARLRARRKSNMSLSS